MLALVGKNPMGNVLHVITGPESEFFVDIHGAKILDVTELLNLMDGDERVRFCRECNRNVYNLSAMPEPEARRVVEEREGRLCVRFYQRSDGRVLTSDCPAGSKRSFLRSGARAALAVAVAATGIPALSACGPVNDEPIRSGEPLMGSPPVDWDGGTPDTHETEQPEALIMGEMEVHESQPLMGRIAPRSRD